MEKVEAKRMEQLKREWYKQGEQRGGGGHMKQGLRESCKQKICSDRRGGVKRREVRRNNGKE